jgi:hypothetical protein
LLRFPLTAGENSKTVFVKINKVLGTSAAFYSGKKVSESKKVNTLLLSLRLEKAHIQKSNLFA